MIERHNLNITIKTLKNALKDRGIRKYRAAHKKWLQKKDYKRRIEFAKRMLKWPAWK
jgi:Transposase